MRILILTFALLLASLPMTGQKKSKVDPKDVQIDTLKMVNKTLSVQLDSVSKELVKYIGVYNAIKEKVLYYSFDPTRSAYLIDSLKASRDSLAALFPGKPKTAVPTDSIAVLLKENNVLRGKADSLKSEIEKIRAAGSSGEIDRAVSVSNLKQLKELLDAKIITEAEFVILKKKYIDKL